MTDTCKPTNEDFWEEIMTIAEPPADLVPVEYNSGTIYVTKDYYMQKGIRMPVDAYQAETIAKNRNMILPTAAMVAAIWRQASLTGIILDPQPLNPYNTGIPNFYQVLTEERFYELHNQMIERQLDELDPERKAPLYAGHKKDLVSGRKKGSVAIYGWHQRSGIPIQPKSNVHKANYKDYSHGLRLVFPMMKKDDKWIRLDQ